MFALKNKNQETAQRIKYREEPARKQRGQTSQKKYRYLRLFRKRRRDNSARLRKINDKVCQSLKFEKPRDNKETNKQKVRYRPIQRLRASIRTGGGKIKSSFFL